MHFMSKENMRRAKQDTQPNEPRWIKLLFATALLRQHRGIKKFVQQRIHLSARNYPSPTALEKSPYMMYI